MNEIEHTDRRNVLKMVGAAGVSSFAFTEQTSAAQEKVSSVNLVEANVHFGLPDRSNYDTIGIDVPPKYHFVSSDEIKFTHYTQEHEKEPFFNNETSLFVDDIYTPPAQVFQFKEARSVPTALTSSKRTASAARLDSKVSAENIKIISNKNKIIVVQKGHKGKVAENEERTIQLEPVDAVLRTKEVTDELVDADHIPDSEKARKIEYDTTEVTLEPEVEVNHYGTVDVID